MASDYSGPLGAYVTVIYLLLFAHYYYIDRRRPQVSPKTCYTVVSQSWNPKWNKVLLVVRLISFCWFFFVAFFARITYYETVKGNGGTYFKWFTHWNIILIWVYFGLTAYLSFLRYIGDDRLPIQCPSPQNIDRYTLAGAARTVGDIVVINAPMVTLVIFGILDRELNFWNITGHLTNTFLPFVDYSLNADVIQPESFKWNLTFLYIYACFVWIMVAARIIAFPYFFLDTSAFGAYTFAIYTGVLLLNGIFYILVSGVYRGLKLRYLIPEHLKQLLTGVDASHGVHEGDTIIDGEYDVIVIGLGAHGSAICATLAARGVKVLGIEQSNDFRRMDKNGGIVDENQRDNGNIASSSHGGSRIIRTAYFKHPAYTPLVQRALHEWRRLDRDYRSFHGLSGNPGTKDSHGLLRMTGALLIGPSDGQVVQGSLLAGKLHNLHVQQLNHNEVKERYTFRRPSGVDGAGRTQPVFNLQPDEVAVYEDEAGILSPEKCVGWLQYRAEHPGENIETGAKLLFETVVESYTVQSGGEDEDEDYVLVATKAASTHKDGKHVRISPTTSAIEGRYKAKKIVLACGAYLPTLVQKAHCQEGKNVPVAKESPELRFLCGLAVVRRTSHWFKSSARGEQGEKDGGMAQVPVYVWERANGSAFYGFPSNADGHGEDVVKVAFHGYSADPSDVVLRSLRDGDQPNSLDGMRLEQHYKHCDPGDIRRDVDEIEVKYMQQSLGGRVVALFPSEGCNKDEDALHVRSSVCQYINTPNEDFLLDFLPTNASTGGRVGESAVVGGAHEEGENLRVAPTAGNSPSPVLVVSCCSGHGFKFASVIGEVAADMLEGRYAAIEGREGRELLDISLFSFQSHGVTPGNPHI